MKPTAHAINVSKNYVAMADETTRNILALSQKVIRSKGQCTIALTGGNTVRSIYARMAAPEYRDQFDWHKMHFFWGDERWVPPDHPKSNYHIVADTFLTKVDIPFENIHPIKTKEGNPESASELYEKEIIAHFGIKNGEFPRFDLMMLGVGQDGHVASLFPGHEVLQESKRLVMPTYYEEAEERRITMTLPVFNHARHIFFVLAGMEKASILHTVLEGPTSQDPLPVQRIHPHQGSLYWFVDKAAASLLKTD